MGKAGDAANQTLSPHAQQSRRKRGRLRQQGTFVRSLRLLSAASGAGKSGEAITTVGLQVSRDQVEPGSTLDVVIVGAGPAGLNAALLLGRCRRQVLVCDADQPRNVASNAMHGFVTRDGIAPSEFLRLGREQLRPYLSVELRRAEVVSAVRLDRAFSLTLRDGARVRCRKLLLATGVVDELPAIEGIGPLYGRSVFHCPYCDGWEVRDEPLAVYGNGEAGRGLALELTSWSRDLVLCTDGPRGFSAATARRLFEVGIQIREERIARLEGEAGILERIVFTNRTAIERRALFFKTAQRQRSDLAAALGCEFTETGDAQTDEYGASRIPGLYVAGDASRAVQLVVVAAAEGAKAAFAINTELLREDLRQTFDHSALRR